MGEVQTLDKSHHSLSGLNLSLFLRFGRPVQGVHLLLCVAERAEGCFVLDSNITLFLDEDSGYRTFGVSFGAVFCCVGAVVRVLKLGWPGFMGGQKVCLGSGFFVVVPRDKSV